MAQWVFFVAVTEYVIVSENKKTEQEKEERAEEIRER